MVGKAPEGPGKGPKKILKILFLEKKIGKRVCCGVPPYRCKSKSKRRERRSKTMKKLGRNVGKKWTLCSWSGEFENVGQKPLGPRETAQKIEKLIFGKCIGKCVL